MGENNNDLVKPVVQIKSWMRGKIGSFIPFPSQFTRRVNIKKTTGINSVKQSQAII